MFDNGVAENDVERVVRKRQTASIPLHALDPWKGTSNAGDVIDTQGDNVLNVRVQAFKIVAEVLVITGHTDIEYRGPFVRSKFR